MHAVRHDVGSVIVRRGEAVEELYFVAVGDIDLEIGEGSFRLSEGDIFGESALVKRVEDDLLAIASSQCLLMSLDLRDLNALINRFPSIGEQLGEMAGERLAAT
jgi:CRP-like cAMP-binding protein